MLLSAMPEAGQPLALNKLLGALGVCISVMPIVVLFLVTATPRFGAKGVHQHVRAVLKARGHSALEKVMLPWLLSTIRLTDLPGRRGFMEQWDWAGVLAYGAGRQWFIVSENIAAALTGVLAGLTVLVDQAKITCNLLQVLQCCVSLVLFGLLVSLRPYGTRLDMWFAILNAAMQSIMAFASLLGQDISTPLSIAQVALSVMYAAVIAWWGFSYGGSSNSRLMSVVSLLFPHQRRDVHAAPSSSRMLDEDWDKLAAICGEEGSSGASCRLRALELLILVACRNS